MLATGMARGTSSCARGPTARAFTALIAALATSCSVDLFHSSHWSSACELDPTSQGCPDAPGGAGGEGSSQGTAGAGAGSPLCGNSTIDPGEECDPGAESAPGCSSACEIECSGQGEHLRPFVQSCYRWVALETLAWGGASNKCVTWGGWLATIDSADEQAFVASLVGDRTWIGANDKALEGTFVWDSGEPWGYENWATDEPSDTLGEDCVELNKALGYAWNDSACADPHPFVCERRPPGL